MIVFVIINTKIDFYMIKTLKNMWVFFLNPLFNIVTFVAIFILC